MCELYAAWPPLGKVNSPLSRAGRSLRKLSFLPARESCLKRAGAVVLELVARGRYSGLFEVMWEGEAIEHWVQHRKNLASDRKPAETRVHPQKSEELRNGGLPNRGCV